MLARVLSLATVSSLFLLAAAGGHGKGGHGQVDQCNNGKVYCCEETHDVKSMDTRTSHILEVLHVDVSNLQGLVGANCSPITVVGGGNGASCTNQAVCCQDNFNNGLVATGCSPTDISL
ncbi:hypothetical protein MD484_g953, partial [Candolleomyces efflorescens]